jgi:hypothetical protein
MSTSWQNLYWCIRPLFWDNPLFKTVDEWYAPEIEGEDTHERYQEHYDRFLRCWEFLRPFFASRGFTLYDYGPERWSSYPPAAQFDPTLKDVDDYPYGRRFYKKRQEGKFIVPQVRMQSQLVWCVSIRSCNMIFYSACVYGPRKTALDMMWLSSK